MKDGDADREFGGVGGAGGAGLVRYGVLGLFGALACITYLDRVCISQASGSIQRELGLSDLSMGKVFSAFAFAYMLFEVPSGWLGDRLGPRRVLARIVLWWSGFTALTGVATGYVGLLIIRFGFGAGEAGAYPNTARALVHWFPESARGRIQGFIWTMSRLGGAIAPVLTLALMNRIGWRWTFAVYGILGLVWSALFWFWYRDDPEDHPAISESELKWMRSWRSASTRKTDSERPRAPWGRILTSLPMWGLSGAMFWTAFGWYFYVTWLPKYLLEGRGWSKEQTSWLSSLPLFLGVFGCALGGWLNDWLVVRMGSAKWARRLIGFSGATLAAVVFLVGSRTSNPGLAIVLMSLASFFNDLPLPGLWAAIMDIGEEHSGAVAGVVNAVGSLGAMISPVLIGYLLDRGWGWNPALLITGLSFFAAGLSWLLVDASRKLTKDQPLA